MTKDLLVAAVYFCLLGMTSWARADVIPRAVADCRGKRVGDSCSETHSGTCQTRTCTRRDYRGWNRDVDAVPQSFQYPCLGCVVSSWSAPDAGAVAASPPADAGVASAPAVTREEEAADDFALGSTGRQLLALGIAALLSAFLFRKKRA